MNQIRQNSTVFISLMSAVLLIAVVTSTVQAAEPDNSLRDNSRLKSILKRMLASDLSFHSKEAAKANRGDMWPSADDTRRPHAQSDDSALIV